MNFCRRRLSPLSRVFYGVLIKFIDKLPPHGSLSQLFAYSVVSIVTGSAPNTVGVCY